MIYTISIQDEAGKPISGATVTFSRGDTVLTAMAANSGGMVSLNDQSDDALLEEDVSVRASAPGYFDSGVSGNALLQDWTFTMQEKPSYGKYIAIGGAAALLLVLAASGGRKKKVSGFFDGMSTGAKLGLAAAGGLAVYYLFFKKDASAQQLAQQAGAALADLQKQGVNPTISATQAEDFASALVTAFDDCGTDEGTVKSVFNQLQNTADVLLLIQVYGVRDYKGCFDGDWFSDHSRNLAQGLTSELSTSDIADLNATMKSKGINYAF